MSARNTLENKRIRRAERELRKGRLPAYIDLVQWAKLRSSLTSGAVRRVILSGALKSDSHTIGVKKVGPQKVAVLERCVPASLRGRIDIVTPKELE